MQVRALTNEKVTQVYPLIQLVRPDLTLDGWRSLALDHIQCTDAVDNGVLTVENEYGYVLGFILYTIYADLRHGRTLMAKDAVVCTALRRTKEAAFAALLDRLETVAQENQCTAIHTCMLHSEADIAEAGFHESLEKHGHRIDHFMLCTSPAEAG